MAQGWSRLTSAGLRQFGRGRRRALGEAGQAVGSRSRNEEPDEALAALGEVGLILLPRQTATVSNRNR